MEGGLKKKKPLLIGRESHMLLPLSDQYINRPRKSQKREKRLPLGGSSKEVADIPASGLERPLKACTNHEIRERSPWERIRSKRRCLRLYEVFG